MKADVSIAFLSERNIHVPPRSMTFVIEDIPIALRRTRMSGTHCWDSQKQEKMIIGIALTQQLKSQPLFTGPLQIDITFHFPIKGRVSKEYREKKTGSPHMNKPDIDNLIKMYLDCASNGILFRDDCLVASVNARKIYGPAKTEIIITEMK